MWQVAEELGGRSGFGTRAVEGRGGAFIISGVQTEPGSRGQPFAGTRRGLAAREWPDVPRGVILMARPARPVTEEGRPAPSRPPASKKSGTSGPPGECAGVFSVGHEHRSPAGVGEPPRRVVQGFLPRGGQGPRAVPPRSREEAYAGTSLTTSLKEENFTCRGCFLTRFYYEKVQIAKSFPGTSVSPPPQCGRYVSLSLPRDTRVRLPLPPAARLLGLATTFDVSGKFAGPRLQGVLGICLSALRLCPDLPFLCPVPTGRRIPGRTVLQLLGGSDKSRRWLREMGAESGCFYYLPRPSPPPPLSLRLGWPQLDYKGLPIHPSGVPAPRRHAQNDPAPTMWPRDPGSLRCWSQGPPATPPSSSFLAGLSLKGEPGSQPHTRDSKRPFGESCRSHPEGPCAS